METSSQSEEHAMDHAVAGALSGFLTRLCCQPLDVIKIRFQLQVEPISSYHLSKYQSILQGIRLILKEEGVLALWKGHIPAQLLSVVYGMGQFYSYNVLVKISNQYQSLDEWKNSVRFVAGAGAGSIATTISFPFDTIRTRLIAQSTKNQVYNGVLHSCKCIVQHESLKVFFYGLSPTLLQIAPHSGLQFAFYGFFTDIYKQYFNDSTISFYNSMVAGSTAGLLSKTIVYPFDLARKRLQIQGFENGRQGFGKFFYCKGLIECVKLTIKHESLHGLFKGLIPSQIKAIVTTALHFTFYEQSLLLLKK